MNKKFSFSLITSLVLLLSAGFWSPLMADAFYSDYPNRSGLCEFGEQLEEALATAKTTLNESGLLLACADSIANRSASSYCMVSDPDVELGFMSKKLEEVTELLLPAVIAAREAARNNPYPRFILQAINASNSKLGDFTALPGDELESIERCSGGRLSYDCLTLVHACSGDFKCYGDGSCACYTCNNGSCGVCPNGGVC